MTNAKVLVKFLPFEVKLQGQSLSIQVKALTNVLKEYFDDYLDNEFNNLNGKTIYAPFSHVSLSPIERRRLLLGDDASVDADEFNMSMSTSPSDHSIQISPVRSGNLRKRYTEMIATYNRYDGVAIYTRDGDLPIPSSNYLQVKQLQAQGDENGDLLRLMQESGDSTGLNSVSRVELGVYTISDTNDPNLNNNRPIEPTQGPESYDVVIIIAVVVAACSMMLLGFALYLAFRRRQVPESMMKTNEISPTTRKTDQDLSPHSQTRRNNQPVFEIKQSALQHDDAISDYTESVYSLPTAVKSAKKAWLKHSAEESVISKSTKVSNRFNPRYIISSKRSNASSSADEGDLLFDNHDVTQEMEGVPQMTSPMKKVLMGSEPVDPPLRKGGERSDKKPSLKSPSGLSESGLYPADVIDDDITSSLSAYGAGLSNHFKKIVDKPDDDVSLSSYESYGFSLDGADYSTIANSTKYGY